MGTEMGKDPIMARGGKGEDEDPPVEGFDKIQKIFGDSDYLTRLMIAQALKLTGREMFPKNSKFPNSEVNKNLAPKDKIFITFYIGDRDQNQIMDEISEDVLKSIEPIVKEMKKSPSSMSEFFKIESSNLPVVKQSSANIGKVKI